MFAGFTGAWLGLSLLKFGNPVILDQLIEPPAGFWEWVFNSWPVGWGYWMLAGLAIAGATLFRGNVAAPRWLIILPLAWLYVRFGTKPQATLAMSAINAAVVAIIAAALWRLARTALRARHSVVIAKKKPTLFDVGI